MADALRRLDPAALGSAEAAHALAACMPRRARGGCHPRACAAHARTSVLQDVRREPQWRAEEAGCERCGSQRASPMREVTARIALLNPLDAGPTPPSRAQRGRGAPAGGAPGGGRAARGPGRPGGVLRGAHGGARRKRPARAVPPTTSPALPCRALRGDPRRAEALAE